MRKNKKLEQFLKSVKRFSDKNCGENKELEQLGESSGTKTALGSLLSLHHLLIALWSVTLSFVTLSFIGATSFLSERVGETALPIIVEGAFFILSGLFAVILWRFLPPLRKLWAKILGFLPPLLIFVFLL